MNDTYTPRTVLRTAAVVLLLIGLVARIAPLFDDEGRVFRQWPTEDGYLMLTIARNMALGNGMSIAAGEIPTNGTQPLATWLWSLAFDAVDGDRYAGVLIVLCLELIFSGACAWLLFLLASRLYRSGDGRDWALLTASVWYASYLVITHSMNCLESSVYTMLVLLAFLLLVQWAGDEDEPSLGWGKSVGLGVLLGACFWARNDAALLIGAVCLAFTLRFAPRFALRLDHLPRTIALGLTTVLISSPWLINNYLGFGHLMPISGISQSTAASLGNNLSHVPIALLEYATVILPIPSAFNGNAVVVGATTLGLLGFVFLGWRVRERFSTRSGLPETAFLLWATAMMLYYGIYHGADWFIPRYFFPLSPFLCIASVSIAAHFHQRQLSDRARPAAALAGVCLIVVTCASLNVHLYRQGNDHMHDQIVEWVEENVREDAWIGAVQTGTLGFFHDRTINLDGKVNPEALDALLVDRIPEYVVERELVAIVDWHGISEWPEVRPVIGRHFSVAIVDEKENLAALTRDDLFVAADRPRALMPD